MAELELDRDDTAAELFHAYQRNEALEIEAESLRAKVEAAIKTAEALRADEDTPSGWGREVAWRILRAMDGAKP